MKDFFQNTDCEYFPCHDGIGRESFNCLFCYCPLYAFGESCLGDYTFTEKGLKDCSVCLFPHRRDQYPEMIRRIKQMYEQDKSES